MEYEPTIKVLVTGFGTYRQFKSNPSWKLVSLLPSSISHRGTTIKILKPLESTKSEYHHIIETIPKLIEDFQPDVILSIGQDEQAKDFKIEKGARRDVHFECPDNARKTLTRVETKKIWDGCGERLETGLNLEVVLERWKRHYPAARRRNGGGSKTAGVDISEDAGNFVCGLLYYAVLAHLKRKADASTKVLFLHIPPLRADEELAMGEKVVEALIKALAEECEV